MRKWLPGLVSVWFAAVSAGCAVAVYDTSPYGAAPSEERAAEAYDAVLAFPADRYPETAEHIASAVANGESAVCTVNRGGAEDNRDASLAGIATEDGYDRDEWPMAMCEEGGAGADVAYVESSDNRGAGAWVGHALKDYPDGTKVLFVVDGVASGTSVQAASSADEEAPPGEAAYASCAAARAAGAAPLREGDPGYRAALDRDRDGIACE